MNAFWPTTGAGWVTLALSGVALVLIPVGYGKWLEKMNGLGGRVKEVEDEQRRLEGVDVERRLEIDRILANHETLLTRVGESKKSADRCLEDAERHAITIGSKVDEARTALNDLRLTLSERLTAVETELRLAKKP
jgi:hypothetical protein